VDYQKLALLVFTGDTSYISIRRSVGSDIDPTLQVKAAIQSCFNGTIRPVSLL
jgi:hypothetical protein